DLLLMTNNVVPIPVRSMASTAAGSVLSRAARAGAPKLVASTWGARLDPPMPHTTTRVNPSRRAASAKRVRSSHCANDARGAAIAAGRFFASRRADRRYAKVLESEVATQTRSLMDSLAATAAAERNLRLVTDAVPDAIAVLDRDGRIMELNEAAKRMVAAPPEEGAGRSVFEFLDAAAATTVRERLAAAFAGDVQRFEVAFRRDDGSKGISALLYAPVRERGEVTRVLALARDITDQKHTEQQLQQAEKLTAMGQLVSGVAHEINNPAAIISGFAQTLLLDEMKPEQRDMLQMIYDEATRIGRITANLLAFARAG